MKHVFLSLYAFICIVCIMCYSFVFRVCRRKLLVGLHSSICIATWPRQKVLTKLHPAVDVSIFYVSFLDPCSWNAYSLNRRWLWLVSRMQSVSRFQSKEEREAYHHVKMSPKRYYQSIHQWSQCCAEVGCRTPRCFWHSCPFHLTRRQRQNLDADSCCCVPREPWHNPVFFNLSTTPAGEASIKVVM